MTRTLFPKPSGHCSWRRFPSIAKGLRSPAPSTGPAHHIASWDLKLLLRMESKGPQILICSTTTSRNQTLGGALPVTSGGFTAAVIAPRRELPTSRGDGKPVTISAKIVSSPSISRMHHFY